ncbi:MAG: hypothetical protein BMS9Abin04_583 [Planctomycetia bacterium]|nr:MAG: hypothetical protein BMS9Abin04_583 [Planctomycetia bacterium]
MRWVGLVLVLLSLAAVLACQLDVGPAGAGLATGRWVRTSDGWECAGALAPRPALYTPSVHPLVFSVALTLSSVMALLAFAPEVGRWRPRR